MVTTHRNADGTPSVWCDPCIEPLIRALNDGGLATVASCCGHGSNPGWVMLGLHGPTLVLLPEDPTRSVAEVLAALMPEATEPHGGAGAT